MPSNLSPCWTKTLVSNQTVSTTASGSSSVIRLPQAETYLFILEVTTLTGTGTTLDVEMGISPSSTIGTAATTSSTWHYIAHFTQVTTSTGCWGMRIQPTMGRGEAGSALVGGSSNTIASAAGTAINVNTPLTPDVRFHWVPNCQTSYTFSIYAYGYAKADASY